MCLIVNGVEDAGKKQNVQFSFTVSVRRLTSLVALATPSENSKN